MAGWLLVWEMAATRRWISPLFFPAPTTILRTLLAYSASGKLVADLAATLGRLLMGLMLGGSMGMLLGLLMGGSPRLRRLVDPLVAAMHPIPKISLLPLVLIIFGLGESSRVVLVAVASFFPTVINTMTGVQQIPPIYYEVAANYQASPLTVFRRIIIPGSLPMILAGWRIALNTALVITIAVELITAREGLGAAIWLAWQTLRTEHFYAALLVIAVLGLGSNGLLHLLSAWLIPWQRQDHST
ncbi:MAG: ABC transporter permease [Anaerolineae bacterium]|nr:ABC transporter permease [Caldilineales bacterium]MCX7852653.1 ABC transporter permease [Caldilineales bacterium]MDW8270374.1 ABC transporter permease [Anaerolineae bacterium]